MGVETESRTIQIDPTGEVARKIRESIGRKPIQAIKCSTKGAFIESEAVNWPEILSTAKDAIAESDREDFPNDDEYFAVESVDLDINNPEKSVAVISVVVDESED